MLNTIWLALILIGTFTALGRDVYDLSVNRYHSGREMPIILRMDPQGNQSLKPSQPRPGTIQIDPGAYHKWAEASLPQEASLLQKAEFISGTGNKGRLHILVDEHTPPLWKDIFRLQKNTQYLSAGIRWEGPARTIGPAYISFDTPRFIKTQAIINDGLIHYAKVAVELSIGLIGLMALWLGLMKIAEQAGLIARLARALKGITRRLFPDVPADHPAMGAMIMNISANMLGLGNAATPLGLKAMEELNKLNKKPGTATDAMCTFLVINTSNVQLIPATVIAIRAAAGSTNPTEILGPAILATTISTVVGLITVKLLSKWRFFKNG
jgi:spore maturation protein A